MQDSPPGLDLPHSSLVLYEPNGHSENAVTCEKAPNLYVIDVLTRQVWRARCRRNSCPLCLPVNARRRVAAIVEAGGERFMTLTLAAPADDPEPVVTARIKTKRLRQALQRKGIQCGEWTWTLERNPKGTGYHAHCVQRGAYLPYQQLSVACGMAGFGTVVDISAIKKPKEVSNYTIKGFNAPGYQMKGMKNGTAALEALAFNGNRIEHHTRQFFWIDGKKMGARDAERYAYRHRQESNSRRYWVGRPEAIEQLLSPAGVHILAMAARSAHSSLSKSGV